MTAAEASHALPEDIQLYVMGALEAEKARDIEAHVVDCEACAGLLEQESSLELSLKHVAEQPVEVAPGRRWGLIIGVTATLALGAAVVITAVAALLVFVAVWA